MLMVRNVPERSDMTSELSDVVAALPLEDNGRARQQQNPRIPRWRPLFMLPLLVLTLFTGAVIGMYFQPPGLRVFFNATGLEPGGGTGTPIAVAIAQVTTQEQVAVISEGDVVALGRIIPLGDITRVATPSGAGDARIAEVRVSEGDTVDVHDILAVLDNLAQLQSTVTAAEANLRIMEATLVKTRVSNLASQQEAQAVLERAKAAATVAKSDLERATSLFDRGITTRAEFDQIIAKATEVERDVAYAQATLSRFTASSDRVQADIAVAGANLDAAKAGLSSARQNLEQAYVRAPAQGTVLDVLARAGERPPQDGIVDLGNTSQMTVEAEVYQTMIGRVNIGDAVIISADALPQNLAGTVSAIGLEIGRQSITSDDPASNTDARVVDVIILLDAPSSEAAQTFTNLEAVVRIDTGTTK